MTKDNDNEFGLEKYLDAKFNEVQGSISGVHTRLDKLNGRVGTLEQESASVRGGLSVTKWLAGIIGLPGLVAFFKAFIFQGK